MAYRPTPRTEARRAETRERIVAAARELVALGGWNEAQVKAVAERAGIATGTVYRYFPSKSELMCEVFKRVSQGEVDAVARAAAQSEDRPVAEMVGLVVETFARRALRSPRLAWALIAEPVDPAVEAERLAFRRDYRDALAGPLAEGIERGEIPAQDPEVAAAAIVGAIAEALVGPLSPAAPSRDPDQLVGAIRSFCIRSVTEEAPRHA